MKTSPAPSRHHTDQERIDRAAELKRQGLSNKRIAAILGCGEKTIRGIVKDVQPELRLPQADAPADVDLRQLRALLLDTLFKRLLNNQQLRDCSVTWRYGSTELGGPPSNRFLNEAERLLQERLAKTGALTLRNLAVDKVSQSKFLREVVGDLFGDYLWWHTPTGPEYIPPYMDGGEWRLPGDRSDADQPPEIYALDLDI